MPLLPMFRRKSCRSTGKPLPPGHLTQRLGGVQMMQHRDKRDQVVGAVQLGELGVVHGHVRQGAAAQPGGLAHRGIDVRAVHFVEPDGQRGQQLTASATNIECPLAASGQVTQDPAVEVLVVVPRMGGVERIQSRSDPLGHGMGQPTNVHRASLPGRRPGSEKPAPLALRLNEC